MEAAIFDIDGTIIDSLYIWDVLASEYLRSLGQSPGEDLSKEIGEMNLIESSLHIKEKFGLEKSSQEIKKELEDLIGFYYKEKFQAKPGALAYIRDLYRSGVDLFIGTTIPGNLGKLVLKRLGIYRCFKEIFTEESLGVSKRQVGFYNKIMEKIGKDRTRTYVFEDSYYAIRSAREAGLKIVLVKDLYNQGDFKKMEGLVDLEIENFTEIRGTL